MEKTDTPILFVDVAGSASLFGYERPLLVDLTRQMMTLLAANAQRFNGWGDSTLIAFDGLDGLYRAVSELARWWRDYPLEAEPVPEDVGLRVAVHVGPVTTSSTRLGAMIGSGVNLVGRLAAEAPVDSVLLSQQGRDAIGPILRDDGIHVNERIIYIPGEAAMRAYEIRLRSLSARSARVIQFAPPTDLLLFLAAQPEELFRVTPRRFEELMAELLSDFGYQVNLTKRTRDDGIDIIAVARSMPLGLDERYLVQCKRNAPDNRVGVSVVRELLGVGVHEPNTGLMIVTTSTFSQPAQKFALKESVRWKLHLRDYEDISGWLLEYARRHSADDSSGC